MSRIECVDTARAVERWWSNQRFFSKFFSFTCEHGPGESTSFANVQMTCLCRHDSCKIPFIFFLIGVEDEVRYRFIIKSLYLHILSDHINTICILHRTICLHERNSKCLSINTYTSVFVILVSFSYSHCVTPVTLTHTINCYFSNIFNFIIIAGVCFAIFIIFIY